MVNVDRSLVVPRVVSFFLVPIADNRVTAENLTWHAKHLMKPGGRICTDGHKSYHSLFTLGFDHWRVNHSVRTHAHGHTHTRAHARAHTRTHARAFFLKKTAHTHRSSS